MMVDGRLAAMKVAISDRWRWFGVALVLLLGVDLLTTLWAASLWGVGAEANPVMRWLLGRGIGFVLLVHVMVLAVAVGGFQIVMSIESRLEDTPRRRYRRWCTAWVAGLVLVGAFAVVNNLLVIALAAIG